MRKTFWIEKAGFKFSVHSREFDDATGLPTTENPTIEFEVIDGTDYADAEDFFGVFDEVTAMAENYDLIAEALYFIQFHKLEDITKYNEDLADLIDTAIDMVEGWIDILLADDVVAKLHSFSEKLQSLK